MPKLRPNQFLLPSGALITEIPLLFQPEMVRANLDDRKNQTRRTRGFTNENPDQWELCWVGDTLNDQHAPNITGLMCFGAMFQHRIYPKKLAFVKSPYGKPGDLLWVKENWSRIEGRVYFQADADIDEILEEYGLEKIRWRPSIHLFKDFSRIWAMVEEIRVERVQDISEEDAIAEGILFGAGIDYKGWHYDYESNLYNLSNSKSSFKTLWRSINGEESWISNPWVWVVKYRILSKAGRPSMEGIQEAYNQIVSPPVLC